MTMYKLMRECRRPYLVRTCATLAEAQALRAKLIATQPTKATQYVVYQQRALACGNGSYWAPVNA
jgi:hypothetical protein